VQGVTGILNRRIKGNILETAPSLPPLKLGREGSFSFFHSTSLPPLPFPKNLRIQIPLAFHLLAANRYRPEAMAP
jgi:hypothetical protein